MPAAARIFCGNLFPADWIVLRDGISSHMLSYRHNNLSGKGWCCSCRTCTVQTPKSSLLQVLWLWSSNWSFFVYFCCLAAPFPARRVACMHAITYVDIYIPIYVHGRSVFSLMHIVTTVFETVTHFFECILCMFSRIDYLIVQKM